MRDIKASVLIADAIHAIMIFLCVAYLVSPTSTEGMLDGRCQPVDTCVQNNTYCNQGVCKCVPETFTSGTECCEYCLIISTTVFSVCQLFVHAKI